MAELNEEKMIKSNEMVTYIKRSP